MTHHFHVHIAYDAAVWKEEQHPRGKGGQFGHGGGGGITASSAAWTGRGNTPGTGGGGLGKTATKHLPAAQKSLGAKLAGVAKSLPAVLKAHGKEQLEQAKHAAGALGSLAHGKKPTPEQRKGLLAFGVSLLLSTASLVTHGDPTGAVGHVAVALGQEFVQHAALEHTAKLAAGGARFVYAAMGGGDAPPVANGPANGFTPAELKLLQDFVATLANTVATYKIPDDRLAELLGQTNGSARR
jgi:hypothetical protein